MPDARSIVVQAIFLVLPLATGQARGDEPDLRTVAESSGFRATARHADVVALGQRLAKASARVRIDSMGRSGEGRDLPLWIVADPPVSTPEEAARSGKLVAFLLGNIHAGEVDGKEGLPILVREIIGEPRPRLLEDLILLVAPIYNADGNERVRKDNRPGQVGPDEGMGQRPNAAGLDLNRDFMKLEAVESRAFAATLNRWDPHLFIDAHTTNGSHHRYRLTYAGPQNPAGDPGLIEYVRATMLPEVGRRLKETAGFDTFPYGNFERDHTLWTGFPALPRFGTNYVGLRNRVAILSEAYSYASYRDRVLATRDFARACLEFAAARKDELRLRLDAARSAATHATPGVAVAIRSESRAFPTKATALGFVERVENGRTVATAEPKDYAVEVVQDARATRTVPRPSAYLLPPGRHERAVATLRAHGLAVEILDAAREADVEVYRVDAIDRSIRPFEGHQLVSLTVSRRTERRRIEAGAALVRAAQPLGALAVYLLEPESDDGLSTWGFFDADLAPGRDFPVLRLPR